jgi:hypothetical protein
MREPIVFQLIYRIIFTSRSGPMLEYAARKAHTADLRLQRVPKQHRSDEIEQGGKTGMNILQRPMIAFAVY